MKKIMCMLSHLCKLRDKLIGIQMVSKHQNPNMTSCNFCRNKDTACNSELSNSSQNLFNTLGIEPLAFLSSRLNFRRCFCSIDSFLYGDFFLWCWNFFRDRSLQIGFKTNFSYKSIFLLSKFTSVVLFFIEALRFSGFLNIFLRIFGFFDCTTSSGGLGRLRCRILGPLCDGRLLIFGSALAPLYSGAGKSFASVFFGKRLSFLPFLTFSRLFWTRCNLAFTAARFSTLNSTIGR